MRKALLLGFVVFGVTAFAASSTFKVNLFQDSVIEGKTFKAGDYKISMENGNAVIKQGKVSVEVPARERTDATKNPQTEMTYGDKTDLKEISLGGTRTTIVFEGAMPMHSGL